MQVLRQQLVPLYGGETNKLARERLEALIHVSRTMLFEMSQRAMHNDRIGILRWNRNAAEICNRLSCAVDYDELQATIRSSPAFARNGSAFVALYDPADALHARLVSVFDSDSGLESLSRSGLCSCGPASEGARECVGTARALVHRAGPGLAGQASGSLVVGAGAGQPGGHPRGRYGDRRRAAARAGGPAATARLRSCSVQNRSAVLPVGDALPNGDGRVPETRATFMGHVASAIPEAPDEPIPRYDARRLRTSLWRR